VFTCRASQEWFFRKKPSQILFQVKKACPPQSAFKPFEAPVNPSEPAVKNKHSFCYCPSYHYPKRGLGVGFLVFPLRKAYQEGHYPSYGAYHRTVT
jgi:hypothetical protein